MQFYLADVMKKLVASHSTLVQARPKRLGFTYGFGLIDGSNSPGPQLLDLLTHCPIHSHLIMNPKFQQQLKAHDRKDGGLVEGMSFKYKSEFLPRMMISRDILQARFSE